MGFIRYLKNKHLCFKMGHLWKFDSYTLGGDWIRCERCNTLDEYLPGVHEPKGYTYRVDLTQEVQGAPLERREANNGIDGNKKN